MVFLSRPSQQPSLPGILPSPSTGIMQAVSKPTVVSLYSGAGGLDLGLIAAGFEVVWANDSDLWATRTYAENIGEHVVCGDVLATPLPDVRPTVLAGGPPCQGFSVIGKMRRDDPRSQHVLHFMDAVEALQPEVFVMENVKALYSNPRWEPLREALAERARQLGYTANLMLLNSADFGVPQARERMFFVGTRGDDPVQAPQARTPTPVTVREALADLPPFGQPGNRTTTGARVVPSRDPVMRPTAHAGSLLFNGSGRPLHLDRPAKTLPASMGGNATPIIDQDELDQGLQAWVVQYHEHLINGGKPLAEAPARLRRITVEEAAALQSFPRDHRFLGPRVAQYRQIGNAVPPKLGQAVGEAVMATLGLTSRQVGLDAATERIATAV